MNKGFSLWPEAASEFAERLDTLHAALNLHNAFFTILVAALVAGFAIKYRRRSDTERPRPILGSKPLEVSFTVIGLLLWLGVFAWGASLYFEYAAPPADAMEIYVTGKQWMFHAQHPEGQREINEIHVPAGRNIRITMTSEDVIHDLFLPALRIKKDLVPGRYTNLWFNANKTGQYHLFCAEYCGTGHSVMGGWLYVMEPAAYEDWLSGGGMGSLASQGEKLFAQYGCSSCHRLDVAGRCPNLTGVFGSRVQLQGGAEVLADESYIRESILNPTAKVVSGYQSIMPSFQGQLNEENVLALIAYVKSLAGQGGPNTGGGGAAGGVGQGARIGQGVGGSPVRGAGSGSATTQGSRDVKDNKTVNRGLTERP